MFWTYQSSEYASGSKDARVLNMSGLTGFWICLNIPDYVWLNMPRYAWICRYMREYAQICLNGFCFIFPYCNTSPNWTCAVLTYFNVYTKLELLVFRKMVLLFVDTKIDFFYSSCNFIALCFRLNIFTRKISNLLLSLGAERGGVCESWHTLF